MNFNFELILFYATLVTGIICLFDVLFLVRRRNRLQQGGTKTRLPILIDYARSFFPVLLIVFCLRSFLFEPFRIPSGSLEPTLHTGDFIIVNKFDYGTRLPVIHKKIFGHGKPERGDIIVFRWPPDPTYDFIKRVIGLPGDHIKYINKELFVNGQAVSSTFKQAASIHDEDGIVKTVEQNQEDLLGHSHQIFIDPKKPSRDYQEIVVPDNMYFVMGDNRDDSMDSRYWGFVPDANIVGKAELVWLSWDKYKTNVRWDRIGMWIQ